jgi:hypothetical protein
VKVRTLRNRNGCNKGMRLKKPSHIHSATMTRIPLRKGPIKRGLSAPYLVMLRIPTRKSVGPDLLWHQHIHTWEDEKIAAIPGAQTDRANQSPAISRIPWPFWRWPGQYWENMSNRSGLFQCSCKPGRARRRIASQGRYREQVFAQNMRHRRAKESLAHSSWPGYSYVAAARPVPLQLPGKRLRPLSQSPAAQGQRQLVP